MQTEKVIDYIAGWLSTYCDKAGMKGFVVGISGGIDSAVTSALCAKTGRPVYVLIMPIYTTKDQMQLAEAHLNWLQASFPDVHGVTLDLS